MTGVTEFFADLVFSPVKWAGVVVAGLAVLLYMTSGAMLSRRAGSEGGGKAAERGRSPRPRGGLRRSGSAPWRARRRAAATRRWRRSRRSCATAASPDPDRGPTAHEAAAGRDVPFPGVRPGPPFLCAGALTCGRSISERTQYGKLCRSRPPAACLSSLTRTYYSHDLSGVLCERVLPR